MPLTVRKHKRRKIPSHKTRKPKKKNHLKSDMWVNWSWLWKLEKLCCIHLVCFNVKLCNFRAIVRNSWDHTKSAQKNLTDMGLSYDANIAVKRAIKHPERGNVNVSRSWRNVKYHLWKLPLTNVHEYLNADVESTKKWYSEVTWTRGEAPASTKIQISQASSRLLHIPAEEIWW